MNRETFDEAGFDAWLANDPRHRSVFDTMWRRTMGSGMDVALNVYTQRRRATRNRIAGGVVALLLMLGGYKAMPSIEMALAQPENYTVAGGNLRQIKLADGSQITLADAAQVNVRYTRHERAVELLHGAIFANVARDEQRPFTVKAGDARIVNVGTSFEVLNKPSNVRVTVASGAIRFGKSGWFNKSISLMRSQAAILDHNGLKRIENVDPEGIGKWRREWAEYKGAPLRQVIMDLQALSPLQIMIADESLAAKPMSGRIKLTDPVRQLQNLSIIYDFKLHHGDEALVISAD